MIRLLRNLVTTALMSILKLIIFWEEVRAAFMGFDTYCGTYKIDTVKGTVTHQIEGARFPNWENRIIKKIWIGKMIYQKDGRQVGKTTSHYRIIERACEGGIGSPFGAVMGEK